MTPAFRNAAAMRSGQYAYDNAEPEHDYAREEAEERIADLLDSGDQETATAFAEYAYGAMNHAEIIDAMAALFRVSDSKWRTLRDRLDDVVGEPLNALRTCMGERLKTFIAKRVEGEA